MVPEVGSAKLVAKKPLSTCDIKRVLKILGMPNTRGAKSTIYRLARLKILKATKPGATTVRGDDKRSNAKMVFDMESVLVYKQKLLNSNL